MNQAKIISTLGPSSSSETILRKMMLSGMEVARLNLSHGSLAEHQVRIKILRKLNKKYRRKIRLLLDLEGHRIRIGKLKGRAGIELKKGEEIFLVNKVYPGRQNAVSFDYAGELTDIKKGSAIFIDDGNIELAVKKSSKTHLKTEVVVAGILKENKGINIPEMNLKFKGLTEKDKAGIHFGITNMVDYIAQSFVRSKADMLLVNRLVKPKLPYCQTVAKIENKEGIRNLDEIMDNSDGIMIARGDMGVSLPIYQVPVIQKAIIKKCADKGKFSITATQMLESMTDNLRPERAEVSDVANAVIDGSNFLMLSAETAAGKHPVEAVKMMHQIIGFTEENFKNEK